jgi:hypothetical protein
VNYSNDYRLRSVAKIGTTAAYASSTKKIVVLPALPPSVHIMGADQPGTDA